MRVVVLFSDGGSVDQPKWEWFDSIFGGVVGIISAIAAMTGWTNRQFKEVTEAAMKLKEHTDQQIAVLHGRINPLVSEVAELRTQHSEKVRRLNAIEESMRDINNKQDQQMKILYRMDGKLGKGLNDE